MKTRTVVLVLGFVAVIGVGGFTAWQIPWVRSWFLRDREDKAEMDQAGGANIKNTAPPDAAAGSPRWRGATGQGVAPAGSFRTDWEKNPPKELWRVPVGGGYGSCSVVGGKLYVQDKQGGKERVVCLDAETGALKWEHAYDAGAAGGGGYDIGPRATPTVVGDWVYTVGQGGKLLAIEQTPTGFNVKWSHDLLGEFGGRMPQWGVACSPLVHGNLVIVQPGGKGAAVVAFDKTTGEVKWKAGSNPPSYSSPIVASVGGQGTVFAFMGDALLAIRPTDGAITDTFKWATDHNANIATPLFVTDGAGLDYVFVSSAYSSGSALLRVEKAGTEVKFVKTVYQRRGRGYQNHHATSVYKDKHLFGIDGQTGGRGLKCIEFSTGKEVEDWGDVRVGQATVILAGNHLILQTATGHLMLVEANPKEYKPLGKTAKLLSGQNNWATPALVDGRIYIRDENHVVCLDVRP